MEAQYAPAIIVLNKKYFPRDALSAAQVGASSFALSVLKVLHDARVLEGVVLYKRDEDLDEAHCETEPNFWDRIPVVTVSFNFRMSNAMIASSLRNAFRSTIHKKQQLSPIVYYQTDTLLQYHPQGFQFCVTHHGPFVTHFSQGFSSSLARLAFGGDSNKVDILQQQQQTGIDRLLQDGYGTVLAHSGLQQRFLEEQGLQPSRFKRLRPPIGVPQCGSPSILPHNMRKFISGANVVLFTAVARLDYFKNVDLMVEAGIELLNRGVPVKVLVIGDTDNDDSRRRALMDSIPPEQQMNFLMLPRLPKDQLYALFAATRKNGIFLCPSRYETLGITPLEAAASGVTTLMVETSNVEALAYIPSRCRVPGTPNAIATRIQTVYHDGINKWAEMETAHVRRETSLQGFGKDLLKAWAEMSCSIAAQRPFQETPSAAKVAKCAPTSWQLLAPSGQRMGITTLMPLLAFKRQVPRWLMAFTCTLLILLGTTARAPINSVLLSHLENMPK